MPEQNRNSYTVSRTPTSRAGQLAVLGIRGQEVAHDLADALALRRRALGRPSEEILEHPGRDARRATGLRCAQRKDFGASGILRV